MRFVSLIAALAALGPSTLAYQPRVSDLHVRAPFNYGEELHKILARRRARRGLARLARRAGPSDVPVSPQLIVRAGSAASSV